ncbi:hypothetical protein GJU41_12030 [Bacillus idriensis]|uniref:Uncharacterized protein n=1 Tax=Metabacillus idriensis TaxID=324768 RepID=A0A6I2MBP0_9BACI|nr:tail assembly chaperone [Metabacillus idriensis]MRX54702.1 hypothetical protein [Metabacillus idriensis]
MVELTLGGKTYEMRFSLKSMRTLEAHYKKPIGKIFKDKDSLESLETLIAFYYACMKSSNKSLTMEKVEDLLDIALDKEEITLEELSEKLSEVIDSSSIMKNSAAKSDEEQSEQEAKN